MKIIHFNRTIRTY